MEKTKVMIVDDHEQMRTLLAEIVEQDDSLTVAATAADGAEAYRLICGMEPDVVLLDLIMPEMDGLTLLERLQAERIGSWRRRMSGLSACFARLR